MWKALYEANMDLTWIYRLIKKIKSMSTDTDNWLQLDPRGRKKKPLMFNIFLPAKDSRCWWLAVNASTSSWPEWSHYIEDLEAQGKGKHNNKKRNENCMKLFFLYYLSLFLYWIIIVSGLILIRINLFPISFSSITLGNSFSVYNKCKTMFLQVILHFTHLQLTVLQFCMKIRSRWTIHIWRNNFKVKVKHYFKGLFCSMGMSISLCLFWQFVICHYWFPSLLQHKATLNKKAIEIS